MEGWLFLLNFVQSKSSVFDTSLSGLGLLFLPKYRHIFTLRQGLFLIERVLQHDIPCKHSLIMLHTLALSSKMQRRRNLGALHPVVEIKEFQFSSPSFFVHNVDDRL
jgi:hypothetical protein